MSAVHTLLHWPWLRTGCAVAAITSGMSWPAVQCSHVKVLGQTPVPATRPVWEREIEPGLFEHRGIARVERIGSRWALTVLCDGVHTTYLAPTTLDLQITSRSYTVARYRYVERAVPDAACVQAPCNVTERLIDLDRLTPVAATRNQADALTRACQVPSERR